MAAQVQPEHLKQILETAKLREMNRHQEATDRLKYQPAVVSAVLMLAFLFILFFGWLALAYGKSEIILPVITALTGLIAGGVGGYGVGKSQGRGGDQSS
ncbi:unnamed protein product [Gemmata massiliana]|uniref:Uncharacterized protein n=2 Tax=Gemmata massiliana TaxID=1210884 RepID=A0A6P2CSH8_9BACT|nr:unnamed protein product [Gemmata massiliana]